MLNALKLVWKARGKEDAAFLLTCYRAYRGDPVAVAEVASTLSNKVREAISDIKAR